MKKMALILSFGLIISIFPNNLGDFFDYLMCNKDHGEVKNEKKENRSRMFRDFSGSTTYPLLRSLFEKYSIENINQQSNYSIPRIIHQIWLGSGDTIPEKFIPWMKTWPQYHPNWTIILWSDADIKYLPLINEDLFNRVENFGEKADILRFELLNIYGGLYVDVDYECRKPFDLFHRYNNFYVNNEGYASWGVSKVGLNNALIGCYPGHPIIKRVVEELKDSCDGVGVSHRTGPIYFTKEFFKHVAANKTGVVSYPFSYFQNKNYGKKTFSSYAHHWFTASWGVRPIVSPKVPMDVYLERQLTPLYKKKQSSVSDNTYQWQDLINRYHLKTFVELGITKFLINKETLSSIAYTGISPIKFLILDYRISYPYLNRTYWWKDWMKDDFPVSDLGIVGDTLEYIPFDKAHQILQKTVKKFSYLLISHDSSIEKNNDITIGQQRTLNMCIAPFNLTDPLQIIEIDNKPYGLWKNG